MAVQVGHARISETGKIYGKKGDQTGTEVCVTNWVNPGWKYMAIHPDAGVRERHARAVEAACVNNNVGYSQYERNTLNAEAKKVSYDLSKVALCNTDCSELQNVAAIAAGTPGVTHEANGWTTSTMLAALKAAGYKIMTTNLTADYAVRGAIYVKPGEHTVCALTNGAKAAQMLQAAGISGSSASSGSGTLSKSPKWVGVVTAGKLNVRSNAGTEHPNIKKWPVLAKGNKVDVCDAVKAKNGSTWYYIRIAGSIFGFVHSAYIKKA